MQRAFVDTGGFVALLVVEDHAHERADILFATAAQNGWRLVTTNAVVVETYSVLLARARNGRQAAISFLDAVTADDGEILVERIQTGDEERAFALVHDHQDKSYSLCDALSFVVMERLGIADAIAFDRHFREYGRFNVLGSL